MERPAFGSLSLARERQLPLVPGIDLADQCHKAPERAGPNVMPRGSCWNGLNRSEWPILPGHLFGFAARILWHNFRAWACACFSVWCQDLRWQQPALLMTGEQADRLLCGASSPAQWRWHATQQSALRLNQIG